MLVRGATIRGACLFAGVLLLACGDGSAPRPSGPPLAATHPSEPGGENAAPVIRRLALNPARPVPGESVQAVTTVEDPDGDAFRLSYRWLLAGAPLGGDSPAIVVPQSHRHERIELEVVATDGRASSQPVRISARIANRAPQLRGVYLEPAEGARVGTPVVAKPDAVDGDDDSLRFTVGWQVNGRAVDATGDTLDTSSLRRGDRIRARVVASDGDRESLPFESPELELGNSPPEVTSRPTAIGSDGVFRYGIEARDPDNDRNLRFRLLEGPPGLTVDPVVGQVVWTPRAEQAGSHSVEVAVDDGHGGVTGHRFDLTVTAIEAEAPPPANQ